MKRFPMPAVMPVFPLPGVVFFPHTTLPLHVFEPRYRQMVRHLRDGNGWMAVALLTGEHPPDDEPPFHEVAGAGVITEVRELEDGRYHIVLDGRARVRLSEVPSRALYRRVEVTPLPEAAGWLETDEAERALRDVLVMAAALNLVREGENPEALLADPFARSVIVNRVASVVMAESEERQALLTAGGYRERTALLVRQLRISLSLAESLARHPRPEDPGRN